MWPLQDNQVDNMIKKTNKQKKNFKQAWTDMNIYLYTTLDHEFADGGFLNHIH